MGKTLLIPNKNLNETDLLGLIVQHSYKEFIPVRNATAGLEAYEPLSIMKCRKRKRTKSHNGKWCDFSLPFWKRKKKEHQGHPVLLLPAEVFDRTPNKLPAEGVRMKKIAQQSSVFELHSTSEWNATYKAPPSPPFKNSDQTQAPCARPCVSLKLQTDTKTPSIDLGNIYETSVKRSHLRKWLKDHEEELNQEELKQLRKTSDLFIIYHVLYSDKIVVRYGSSSGEKRLDVGPASASSTFQTQGPAVAATIRPEDVGKKPIAFKVTQLLYAEERNRRRRVKLRLAPQQPTDIEPRCLFPSDGHPDYTEDSQTPTNSSDESCPSISGEDNPSTTNSTPPSHHTRALRSSRSRV